MPSEHAEALALAQRVLADDDADAVLAREPLARAVVALAAERDAAVRAIAERDARIAALEAALREVEWSGAMGTCPACLHMEEDEHATTCRLHAALAPAAKGGA